MTNFFFYVKIKRKKHLFINVKDLVELIKTELNFLNLVDKKDIQNHIYHRIGEIFEYNPYWKFASVLEQYKIAKRKIDVHNVTDFYAVCFELAPMAV